MVNRTSTSNDSKMAGAKIDSSPRVDEVKCYNCMESGHVFRNCPKERVGKFCYRCGKTDVTTNECTDCPKNRVSCLESEEGFQTDSEVNEQ